MAKGKSPMAADEGYCVKCKAKRKISNAQQVKMANGRLSCDCDHYLHERLCAHVLTVERVLKTWIPANAAPFPGN